MKKRGGEYIVKRKENREGGVLSNAETNERQKERKTVNGGTSGGVL